MSKLRSPWSRMMLVAIALALPGAALAESEGSKGTNLAQVTKRTLLAFPFDVPEASVPGAAEITTLLTDVARSRLIASGSYTVVTFNRGLPTVARLFNDQQLSDADVTKPFAQDNAKATKVVKATGYEVAFVGSVDDYQYAEADKQATMTVSGRILDVTNGRILRSATLSSTSAKGGNAKEPERAEEAARSAGEKLMTQLVPTIIQNPNVPVTPIKTQPGPSKKRSNGWIWGLLAVGIGLGIGLASGSGRGGGGSDGPPAPPN